ncbi:hypothetical protein PPHE_a6000 [Pseudoalteromonas phenolica O-BC30]|nr:hypothetical protein [Pseudoalteromonas phenolica O-BC30]
MNAPKKKIALSEIYHSVRVYDFNNGLIEIYEA